MPTILCDVYNCYHNVQGGCKLPFIKVEGERAEYSDETLCESYTSGDLSMKNSAYEQKGIPNEYADVECSAEGCKYNNNCVCTADYISVGDSTASSARETECESFDSDDN